MPTQSRKRRIFSEKLYKENRRAATDQMLDAGQKFASDDLQPEIVLRPDRWERFSLNAICVKISSQLACRIDNLVVEELCVVRDSSVTAVCKDPQVTKHERFDQFNRT